MAHPAGTPVNILLVDDRPENLLALEALLGDLGHRILKAQSGTEALKLLLQEDFALILLDVQMPDMDGFETAQLIRGRERLRHIPIVFITANYQADEHVARGYQVGALDYMLKPVQPTVLRAKVGALIELAHESQILHVALHQQQEVVHSLQRDHVELEHRVQTRTEELETANLALHQEISERLRVEDELRERDRAKDAYLAMLGHELRNPLSALSTACHVMNQFRAENAMVERSRSVIQRQVRHLSRLVDGLLDAARLTQGKLTLKPEPTDLAELLRLAAEDTSAALDEHGHTLTLELPPEPVWVEGDAVRLSQILINLLVNAAKYTPTGGRIQLSLVRADDEAVVTVSDTGVGMDANVLPRIFEPFYQAVQATGSSEGGLGIGLTLARTLAELHHGTLEAHSAGPHQGSEFVVRLPVLVAKT